MSRTRAAAVHRAPAVPRHPRRVSGPVARPVPVPGRPRPSTPVTASHALGTTLRALPDHRLLDTLLRSRAWIWLLGVALGGIVFMQVSLLQMNNGIGNAVARTTALEHQNALLAEEVATLSSGERIGAEAERLGLIAPDAGQVGFLETRGSLDATRAIANMTPPSDAARAALGTGGLPVVADPAVPETTTAAPVETAAPVATAEPALAPEATAAPVTTPAATAEPVTPVATAAPPTEYTAGATAAP